MQWELQGPRRTQYHPVTVRLADPLKRHQEPGVCWLHSEPVRFVRVMLGGTPVTPVVDPADFSEKTLLLAIDIDLNQRADVEHFTLMALAKLEVRSIADSPPAATDRLPLFDRFTVHWNGKAVLVVILDTHEQITTRIVEQIAAAMAIRHRSSVSIDAAICIINDQNGIHWEIREPPGVDGECHELAEVCGISLVKVEDLARLSNAVHRYSWPADAAFAEIIRCGGWRLREPPNGRQIGIVRHFYDKVSAVSVTLNGTVEIAVGSRLAYRLRRRFYEETLKAMQQNRQVVSSARIGDVGIMISLSRHEIPIGADVFLLPPRAEEPSVAAAVPPAPESPPQSSPEGIQDAANC